MKKTGLYSYVYHVTAVNDILDIHKYLMEKEWCMSGAKCINKMFEFI